MKNFTLTLLFLFTLSVATPKPSYAWGKVGPGTIAFIGVGAVITAPIWLVGGVFYLAYKGAKKIGKEIGQTIHNHEKTEGGPDTAAVESSRKTLQKFYTAIAIQLERSRNLYVVQNPDFDRDHKISDLIAFFHRHSKLDLPEMDIENLLCKFRTTFLGQMEPESLHLEELGKMFEEYEKNSIIPAEFIGAAQAHLGLNEEAARRIFSILYSLTLDNHIRLSMPHELG